MCMIREVGTRFGARLLLTYGCRDIREQLAVVFLGLQPLGSNVNTCKRPKDSINEGSGPKYYNLIGLRYLLNLQ